MTVRPAMNEKYWMTRMGDWQIKGEKKKTVAMLYCRHFADVVQVWTSGRSSDWPLLFYKETFLSWWKCLLPAWLHPIHRAPQLTDWFDEEEDDVNCILWVFTLTRSQPSWTSTLWEFGVTCCTAVISLGRMVFTPAVQFQRLIELEPRYTEAV